MPHIHLHTFAHRSLRMNGSVVFSFFRSPKVGEEGGEVLVIEAEGGSSFQGTPPELMFHTCAQCGSLYQPSQVRHINCGRDHFAFHRGVPFGSQHVLPNLRQLMCFTECSFSSDINFSFLFSPRTAHSAQCIIYKQPPYFKVVISVMLVWHIFQCVCVCCHIMKFQYFQQCNLESFQNHRPSLCERLHTVHTHGGVRSCATSLLVLPVRAWRTAHLQA